MVETNAKQPHGGWQQIADAIEKVAGWSSARVSVDSSGATLQTIRKNGGTDNVDGAIATARELSTEICRQCGGPGTPRRNKDGSPAAAHCDECAGDLEQAPAAAWMPNDDDVVEYALYNGAKWTSLRVCRLHVERAEALINRRDAPEGKPDPILHRRCGGWNHLIRALLRIALDERRRHPGLEIGDLKEKWAALSMHIIGGADWHIGIAQVMSCVSEQLCQECGKPGTPHDGREHCEGVYIACARCQQLRVEERERRRREWESGSRGERGDDA